jgi:CubicO group peptidase (beta-lactamase class C family)
MKPLLLCLLLVVPPVMAADAASEDIHRFAEGIVRDLPIPSMGIAVVRDGKPYMTFAVGQRDLAQKLPATPDTAYYIASSTKSYTGLLASVLAQRGKIDLDAPITKYLPDLTLPANAGRVTMRTLLTHTSGLDNDAIILRTAFTGDHNSAQLVKLMSDSTVIEPKFKYDNLGYVVVSLALERVTGKKWQDLLDQLVFTPLRMNHTTAYMTEAKTWPLATAYGVNRQAQITPMTMLKTDATMHAAGGIVTTPRDLSRWLEANINQGKGLPKAAFQEAQRQQATTDANWYRFKRTGYGFGWYHSDYEGDLLVHHFGGFEGWRAHVSFMPEKKIGVAVVTNVQGPGSSTAIDMFAAYVYDRLLGKENLEAKYQEEGSKLRTRIDEQTVRYRADAERRSKRSPSLLRDRGAYAGVYTNEKYGTLTIAPEKEGLAAAIGVLHATLEPFEQPDTARVELIEGSGEVLRFVFDGAEKAGAIKWRDETFARSDPRSE